MLFYVDGHLLLVDFQEGQRTM
ncbi:hypothetical protein MTR67_045403 [Solanum verrucosum]|uniref:Uncharacterized protein n=1 Tax=Solanum verrucosum TaxID=315347 RepID=A0AAF0UVC5_SOLVR|nr:hypothetical protein MTR67_045403 [Solanum verrucosum]